ncbi:MAG: fasciclin domain-containing protein [Tolypothrix sp. Co-bin9]|nr:fasciclin domain-containing protein [Tolypothrix sp. Co-bin9]
MLNKNPNTLITKNWIKKLTCFVGIAGLTTLISFPVLAKYYARYALFQPSTYGSAPYRNSNKNIAETLRQDSKFANLVDELKQAGLLDTLKQKGDFTVFAPTDKAFNALPKDVFKQYSQPENRMKVLKYHLVAGKITKEKVDSGAVTTLAGQPIKIVVDDTGTAKLNDANAKYPSTVASNGVIIEVDKVLLPPKF